MHDCEYAKPQRACQRGKEKNDKASRCCWSAYQEKRLGKMGLGKMRIGKRRLGKMRLGEMRRHQRCSAH